MLREEVAILKEEKIHKPKASPSFADKVKKSQKASNKSEEPTETDEDSPIPHDVLWVGDSHSNNLDRKEFERMTNTKVDMALAYTVDSDPDARYPERNLIKILPEKISKKKYDTLVLQGGSNEISNLKVDPTFTAKDVSDWEEKIRQSRTKLFNLAESCLSNQKELKTVIILTSLPRYDPLEVDPNSIKAKLNNFGNSLYSTLWMQRGCPKNIMIYDQKLDCNGVLREKRFGIPGIVSQNGKPWDGTHMRGHQAMRHYTNSVARIFGAHFSGLSIDWSKNPSESNYHPTRNFQHRNFARSNQSHRAPNYNYHGQQYTQGSYEQGWSSHQAEFGQSRGFKRNNKHSYEDKRHGPAFQEKSDSYYNIPVANRFNLNY